MKEWARPGIPAEFHGQAQILAEPFARPSAFAVPAVGTGVALVLPSARWLARFGIALAASVVVVFGLTLLQAFADHLPSVRPHP
jgi:hypothetical protein